ncbi:MAG: hypothetical protein AAGC53_03840 [Actinomycetota bacterium]
MPTSLRWANGSVMAVALLLAGCGGDDAPSTEESEAIGVLIDAELTLDEQRCILDGLQGLGIGADRIVAGDLTADEDAQVFDVSLSCVDDLGSIDAFVDSFIEGAAEAGTTLSREQAQCAIRALDETGTINDAIVDCLDGTEGPQAEGDDPVLDLLVEQCRRGNNQACDELFADSPVGSDYAAYGQTCGNRLPDGAGLTCFDTLG